MDVTGYDFGGWATRNDLLCSDKRVIRKNAFKDDDGRIVPLVFNHRHNDVKNVLGHALLENRPEGVYAYGFLNDTAAGRDAKEQIRHGDITALSIYANNLKQNGGDVIHGVIREVSLVLAGANPGALIDDVMIHGEEAEGDARIFTGMDLELAVEHSEESVKESEDEKADEPVIEHAEEAVKSESKEEVPEDNKEKEEMAEEKKEKTIQDVLDELTEEQRKVVNYLVGEALNDGKAADDNNEGEKEMKHNLFEDEEMNETEYLSHDEMASILKDAKRIGSMKESFLAHADEYGIENIDYLFPEAKNVNNMPEVIARDNGWVNKIMNGVHHTPFSRIKSIEANITEDDARAKGYIKGNYKKDEIFALLKRVTGPTTVYKKQKVDKNDVDDITDFDVISWLKAEMRAMLNEELARAFLVGDGRDAASDDKIDELCIRPIWKDADLYTVKALLTITSATTDDQKAKQFIRTCIKSRKMYKGSGNPILFTTEDMLTDCLLVEDGMGRPLYDTEEKLRTALRVREIVAVPVMEGLTRNVNGTDRTLLGLIVNPADYNVGADKGGAVSMFDDFDIDYNQMKYLIETRCSGALVKPFSAVAVELAVGDTGSITIGSVSAAIDEARGVTAATDNFTGDASTKAFTLSHKPVRGAVSNVTVGGTATTAYKVSGSTITFTAAPADDAAIVVSYNYYTA